MDLLPSPTRRLPLGSARLRSLEPGAIEPGATVTLDRHSFVVTHGKALQGGAIGEVVAGRRRFVRGSMFRWHQT